MDLLCVLLKLDFFFEGGRGFFIESLDVLKLIVLKV